MLKPTLYIGLGGTGMRTLLKTKKQFIDTYGEIPPMIQFLGFDTDQGVYERKDTLSTQEVYLTKAEQCSISVPGAPSDYYNSNSRELSWLPKENVRMIQNLDKGAGQVRTNGRLAFVYNVKKIEVAIRRAIDNCRAAEPANDWPIDVHIVFSLAGGTGSGIFIDVAYLIRKIFSKSVNMYGYAVLPTVFWAHAGMLFNNAFGALQDLDYLMHLDHNNEQPVTFNWIANSFTEEDFRRTPNPYDLVYLVDNKNARGVTYATVDNLADVISLALVAASGEIGTTNRSIYDNCLKVIETGVLDVYNKKAWVAGFGTSSVVFHPDVLAARISLRCINDALDEDYGDLEPSLKAIEEIIDKDRVLAVFHNEKEPVLKPSKSKSFVAEADKHCDTAIKLAKESAEKAMDDSVMNASELLSDTESKLLMSSPGCITATLAFLDKAKAHVDSTIDELTIDLAHTFDDDLLSFGDFYTSTGEESIESIETSEELRDSLFAFIDNLPKFNSWKEKTISEVIDLLPDEVFSDVFRRALAYSEPMLMIDGKGFNVESGAHTFIIGVENRENSRFVKSYSFQESTKTRHIEFVSTGIKNRVIFYHQYFAFPAFTVQGVDDWRRESEMRARNYCPHFDSNILNRMVRENYSINPKPDAI